MKYYPRLKQYKASNLVFDESTKTAYSYKWYEIAKEYRGKMIVNNYYYSSTTNRHIRKLIDLFDSLGINYVTIEAPRGLQSLDLALDHYSNLIKNLENDIAKPRSQAKKNEERLGLIQNYTNTMVFINELRGNV